MKKPLNYLGTAFNDVKAGYNKDYLKSKAGKREMKKAMKIQKKHQKQIKTRGFDDTELWALDESIIKFTLPRLKAFKGILHGHPSDLTEKKWEKVLDSIILSFEMHLKDEWWMTKDETESEKLLKQYNKGFKLFGKYLRDLWD